MIILKGSVELLWLHSMSSILSLMRVKFLSHGNSDSLLMWFNLMTVRLRYTHAATYLFVTSLMLGLTPTTFQVVIQLFNICSRSNILTELAFKQNWCIHVFSCNHPDMVSSAKRFTIYFICTYFHTNQSFLYHLV